MSLVSLLLTSSSPSGNITLWERSRTSANTMMTMSDRDQSVYGLSQWETTLQCNVVSHWLGPYTEWCLYRSRLCTWLVREGSALDISRSFFLWRTHERHPTACPWGWGMGVVSECKAWSKFYHCNCCAVCTTVLYMAVIYRYFIITRSNITM